MWHSFLLIFIQFYIIASFFRKINTFFKFFSEYHIDMHRAAAGGVCPAQERGKLKNELSSMIFCTKKIAVVIITGCKKVGILSKPVDNTYVNPDCIFIFRGTVDNLCGKSCGECGKVRVFNSYSAFLENRFPMWKTLHKHLHTVRSGRLRFMLRHRRKEVLSSIKSSKMFKTAVILTVKKMRGPLLRKIFCRNNQKIFSVSTLCFGKYFLYPLYSRRTPCREK